MSADHVLDWIDLLHFLKIFSCTCLDYLRVAVYNFSLACETFEERVSTADASKYVHIHVQDYDNDLTLQHYDNDLILQHNDSKLMLQHNDSNLMLQHNDNNLMLQLNDNDVMFCLLSPFVPYSICPCFSAFQILYYVSVMYLDI